MVIDEASSPSTNDPGAVIDNNGLELAQNTELPLIFFNKSSYSQFVPVLATNWSISPDGMTYTFWLRHGVYYSNGDPFNAYVVWWNIYRDMYINQPADFIFYTYFNTSGVTVHDLNEFNNSQNAPTNATLLSIMQNPSNSVTVVNPYEVQFHLTNPFEPFLYTIGTAPWVFVDPHVVEQHGGVVANQPNSWMAVNGTTVGDGPYITQQYVPNQFAVLIANPHYWAANQTINFFTSPPHINKVIIYYKTDELTRSLDLESNKAQAAIITFNDIKSVLSSDSNLYIPNTGLSGSLEFITIDTEKYPTNNTLVRRAIISAINITQIEQEVYNGYAVPFVGPEPKGFFGYNSSITPPPYNVTLAKQLLKEAGYPNGQGLPTINFVYPTSAYLSLVAEILQQDLAQVGIKLQPQQVSFDTWLSLSETPGNNTNAPLLTYGSWTYYPDFSAYEFIVDQQLGAFFFLNNQTINTLILESNTQLNQTLRAEEISLITLYVKQNAAVIWLGQDVDLYDTGGGFGPVIWNKCLSGMWYNTAFNGIPFNSVYYTCNPS
ncbi:MAG: ABC transporter substrate-binding protein [Thermoprotei archaeon]